MTKHIELTHKEMEVLMARLLDDWGQSIRLSWVMKRELGITIRKHQFPSPKVMYKNGDFRDTHSVMCIDFYDETAKSWFLLKYM